MGIVVALICGGLAGWLASLIMRSDSKGQKVNILLGFAGGLFGFWLFGVLGILVGIGILSTVLVATLGAVVLIFIVQVFSSKR